MSNVTINDAQSVCEQEKRTIEKTMRESNFPVIPEIDYSKTEIHLVGFTHHVQSADSYIRTFEERDAIKKRFID